MFRKSERSWKCRNIFDVVPTVERSLQTVDQALTLLEHLAGCQEPRSLTRLAQELGTSKPRMHRLLATLRGRGFVAQDPETLRYSFGPSSTRLVEQWRVGLSATEACLPVVRALWQRTEETILLAVYRGGQAVVIEKLDSPRPVLARSELGATLPLHAVSTGKVLLASRSDAEIETIMRSGLTRYTPDTRVDPESLWAEIGRIRRLGYAINKEGYRPGVCGVAAPVRDSRGGSVAAAIGVCAPATRFSKDLVFLRDQVLAAATAASHALGGMSEVVAA
jgi:IclR family KDG regulon transcriptional repressor